MEVKKNKQKVINIARMASMDPSTCRQALAESSKLNIFNRNSLQISPITNTQKSYNLVGLNQLQQYLKRVKKTNPIKKYAYFNSLNSSLKSYTAKSNEAEDLLLTKEEILTLIKQSSHGECSPPEDDYKISGTCQLSHLHSSVDKKQKKFRIKNNRFSDKLDKYQQKVEVLKKYTLHQKKQNISIHEWRKVLRSQVDLSQVFDKNDQYFQTINRNGFKVVALSKKKKQIDWISSQKESALFQFIEKKKNAMVANLKLRKKEELIAKF